MFYVFIYEFFFRIYFKEFEIGSYKNVYYSIILREFWKYYEILKMFYLILWKDKCLIYIYDENIKGYVI